MRCFAHGTPSSMLPGSPPGALTHQGGQAHPWAACNFSQPDGTADGIRRGELGATPLALMIGVQFFGRLGGALAKVNLRRVRATRAAGRFAYTRLRFCFGLN